LKEGVIGMMMNSRDRMAGFFREALVGVITTKNCMKK
jgi:hypothetical protein